MKNCCYHPHLDAFLGELSTVKMPNSIFNKIRFFLLFLVYFSYKTDGNLHMSKNELLLKEWNELIHCMEMEMQAKDELIEAQKGQIRHLQEQVILLEEEKRKLTDAGNMFSEQCEKLEKLCTSQQELIEEFQALFSDLQKKS